jgi:hypothetical protein
LGSQLLAKKPTSSGLFYVFLKHVLSKYALLKSTNRIQYVPAATDCALLKYACVNALSSIFTSPVVLIQVGLIQVGSIQLGLSPLGLKRIKLIVGKKKPAFRLAFFRFY